MNRIFEFMDDLDERKGGGSRREDEDYILEKAFKEGCEHGYKKAMREAGFDERGGSGNYRGSYREGFEEKIEKLKKMYR